MGKLQFHSVASTGDVDFDYGIRDIEVLQEGDDFAVFTSTGAYGGMAGYQLNGQGALALADTQNYAPVVGASLFVGMSLLDQGGQAEMLVGGHGSGWLTTYNITTSGQISDTQNLSGVSSSQGPQVASVQLNDTVFLANPWGNGVLAYAQAGNSLSLQDSVSDTSGSYGYGIHEMVVVNSGGTDYLITAAQGQTTSSWSASETGVTSYQVDGSDNLSVRDNMGTKDGDGLMVPTDMATATVSGKQYIVLSTAYENSGALSVIEVEANGNLALIDHVGDTRDTRFGAAQAVDAIEVDGRTYVVSGGGDDGVSLFLLAPGGRLVHLDTFADTNQSGLDGVTDLALAQDGDYLHVFASSQADAGLTQLRFDISDVGETHFVSGAATGGGLDDVLVGRDTNDNINGAAGDDILIDGAGSDTLTGGAGRDVFVLVDDDTTDRITDFDVTQDEIDLSGWAYFKDPDALEMTYISGGVRISWQGEQLDVISSTPGPLDFDDLRAAISAAPTRVFEAPTVILSGGSGADLLVGDWAADTLSGAGGNDTLRGYDGSDSLRGGNGHDLLEGGKAGDWLYGDLGHDTLRGGDGEDTLTGGADQDTLWGENGNDTLTGGTANDSIDGGVGEDLAVMGTSQQGVTSVQQLSGNRVQVVSSQGTDIYTNIEVFEFSNGTLSFDEVVNLQFGLTLRGGAGADSLTGGTGHDTIMGFEANDTLVGGAGDDVLVGGRGDDLYNGQDGTDQAVIDAHSNEIVVVEQGGGWIQILSEDGTDRFYGVESFQFQNTTLTLDDVLDIANTGGDVLSNPGFSWTGGEGDDNVTGSAGADTLKGGAGDDDIKGSGGNDQLWGGQGDDTIKGGPGDDKIYVERGNNRAVGQSGNDTMQGNVGKDNLKGGGGEDRILGDGGNDYLKGGGYDDVVKGGKGDDVVLGNNGNDQMEGGAAQDTLKGGSGSDTIDGGRGDDYIKGGDGGDEFIFDQGDDRDRIVDFNINNDTLLLSTELVGASRTGGEVLDKFATVTGAGVVLDFGNGDEITLLNLNSLSGLADNIDFI